MKKLIYLISPNKVDKSFYKSLNKVLAFKNVKFFQLRLKNKKKDTITRIAKKIKKITEKYKVKLIINDDPNIVKNSNADGCHIGQKDISINKAKEILKNKIIGVTCHGSKTLAKIALQNNVNYLAFGSFHKSKLKPNAKKSKLNILRWAKKNTKKPIVAIGGIDNLNYKKLLKSGANYIAISSFIWDNPNLEPELAIRMFK